MKASKNITPETILETLAFSKRGEFSYITCEFVWKGTKYDFILNVDSWGQGSKRINIYTQRLSLSRSSMTNRSMTEKEMSEKWAWGSMVFKSLEFAYNFEVQKTGVRTPSES